MHIFHLLSDLSLNTDDFEEARFVEKITACGQRRIYLYKNGHIFNRTNMGRTKNTKSNSYWLCKEYYNRKGIKCTARATTKDNEVLYWNGHHNHDVVKPSNKTRYK